MYYQLGRTKSFLKDIKKVKFTNQHYAKYAVYLGKLLSKEMLPPEAKDHQLQGNWNGHREFHISGDLLVIYKIKDETLFLTRIGSHAQLFE